MMGVIRRPVPTLIHDGKAYVEAIHYDQARTDNDYAENAFRENESLRQQLEGTVEALEALVEASETFFKPNSPGAPLWPRTVDGRKVLTSLRGGRT